MTSILVADGLPAQVVTGAEGHRPGLGKHREGMGPAQGFQEVDGDWRREVEAEVDHAADRLAGQRLRGPLVDRRAIEELGLLEPLLEAGGRPCQQLHALGVGRFWRMPVQVLRPDAAPAEVLQCAFHRGAEAGLPHRLLQIRRGARCFCRFRGRGQSKRHVDVLGDGREALHQGLRLGHLPRQLVEQREADGEVARVLEEPVGQPGAEQVRGDDDRDREVGAVGAHLEDARLDLVDRVPHHLAGPGFDRCGISSSGSSGTRAFACSLPGERSREFSRATPLSHRSAFGY